ncbi:aldo/keto reductase [Jiangella endophytica]|uniref:aldo/keto reductase n=1 Tax=Jiangella endophytica TaxID=1623398 RepID=UPI0018E4E63E|nr:aldo/keto reductase [Jiangella endophytica]
MLQIARLGRTDMDLTRVGFGAWAIGGADWTNGWGAQDDDDSVQAIRHAVESGVNWIDTAGVYGFGHSEEVVARALRDLPPDDRPYVFTKGGLVWDPADRSKPATRVGAPDSIRRDVESSLRRLGVERIDLFQMHWPAGDDTPVEEYWQTFRELVDEGKIRAAGLSNHDVEQLDAAESAGPVDALQPPLSLIHRAAAADVIPWAAAHDTGVIVYSPMASGLLTGSFTAERAAALGADDWRSRDGQFTGDGLRRNLGLVEDLRPIAERNGVGVAALAVAWTLHVPGVTAAIVGARRPGQVDGWIAAAGLRLDAADLDDIAAAVTANDTGTGPVRP